jgi:hypothetical protein
MKRMTIVIGTADLPHGNNNNEIQTYNAHSITARLLTEITAPEAPPRLLLDAYKVSSFPPGSAFWKTTRCFVNPTENSALKILFYEAARISDLVISNPWKLVTIEFLIHKAHILVSGA